MLSKVVSIIFFPLGSNPSSKAAVHNYGYFYTLADTIYSVSQNKEPTNVISSRKSDTSEK